MQSKLKDKDHYPSANIQIRITSHPEKNQERLKSFRFQRSSITRFRARPGQISQVLKLSINRTSTKTRKNVDIHDIKLIPTFE